jgi:hypothetical protein
MDVEVSFHGSMIVCDFDAVCVVPFPTEAYSILVVYTNAVLTGPVALERLESVARRNAEFIQVRSGFKLREFSEGDLKDGGW